MLHIKSIEIDEIDIGALVYEGVYTPEYPEPWASQQLILGKNLEKILKGTRILGHNGNWTFKFRSPFYQYIINWIKGNI